MHCFTDMQLALALVGSFFVGSVVVYWVHRYDIFR
jgi:uncharacterized protein YjeT (DUF2065 family)